VRARAEQVSYRHLKSSQYRGTAGHVDPTVVKYFLNLLAPKSCILDVGCGQGAFLSERCFGIDLDFQALQTCEGRAVQGDLTESLPFRADTFDGILAKDIIEHVANPIKLLLELYRIGTPGARLVLTTPRAIPRAVWSDYTHVRGFTKTALVTLLDHSNWNVQKIGRLGSMPLAGRLGLTSYLPMIMKLPGIGHYYGTNWQVIAQRR
jgi:SAM-dependent methyltransferase